jgi:hypothetical protein
MRQQFLAVQMVISPCSAPRGSLPARRETSPSAHTSGTRIRNAQYTAHATSVKAIAHDTLQRKTSVTTRRERSAAQQRPAGLCAAGGVIAGNETPWHAMRHWLGFSSLTFGLRFVVRLSVSRFPCTAMRCATPRLSSLISPCKNAICRMCEPM